MTIFYFGFRRLSGRVKLTILFALMLATLIAGGFIWDHMGNPMPRIWHQKATSNEGIWKSDGLLEKFERWRHRRVEERWKAHTRELDLGGTWWTTDNRLAIFHFSQEGVFRCWWAYSDALFIQLRTKIDGAEYEFDGTRGYAGHDGERTFASGFSLVLKKDGPPMVETRLGFDGDHAFLILRDPPYTIERRLWRTDPGAPDFPSHLKSGP